MPPGSLAEDSGPTPREPNASEIAAEADDSVRDVLQQTTLARAAIHRSLKSRYRIASHELDRILDAAYALIQRRGTVELTVRDLLREAGMTTETFYRLFASKEEFLDVLVEDGGLRLAGYLEHQVEKAARAAAAGGRDTARAGIEAWVRGMLAQSANPDAAARGRPFVVHQNRLVLNHEPAYRRLAESLIAPLSEAITAGVSHGSIKSQDPASDARCTFDLVMAVSNRHILAGTAPSTYELDHLIQFCLAALHFTLVKA